MQNKPGTRERFRWGLQIPMTDGLTDWRPPPVRLMDWRVGLNFLYFFWNQGDIQNRVVIFKYFSTKTQIAYFLRPFEEKHGSQMEKGLIKFCFKISGTGGKILNKMTMLTYFCTYTQIVYFLDHLKKKKSCSLMEKGRIEFSISFLELGGKLVQKDNVQLFCYINSNCVFSNTIWRKKRCSPIDKGPI